MKIENNILKYYLKNVYFNIALTDIYVSVVKFIKNTHVINSLNHYRTISIYTQQATLHIHWYERSYCYN